MSDFRTNGSRAELQFRSTLRPKRPPQPRVVRVGGVLPQPARRLHTTSRRLPLSNAATSIRARCRRYAARDLAIARLREVIRSLLAPGDPAVADRAAEELALFALVVCDGAFVQHHIEPETDVRRLFALLARALNALGAEILAEAATAS